MKKKVSILIGLYNVAKFLKEKKLSCIFNQTYSNWELILVNDGSTDETSTLCDEFAKSDSRIKVIHQQNGGLGSARNTGLEAATGDYIWFYDVDDEADENLLQYCVEEIEKRNVDLLVFGFYAFTPSLNRTETITLNESEILNEKDLKEKYLDNLLFIPNGNGFAWNKFYKKSFLDKYHLRFGYEKIQQDECFNLTVYLHNPKIYISPKSLYKYFIYNSGNNRSRFIAQRFDIYKTVYTTFKKLQQSWNLTDPRFDTYLYKKLYTSINQCLQYNLFHHQCPWNKNEKQNELNRIMNDTEVQESIQYILLNQHLSIEEKLYIHAYYKKCLGELAIYFYSFQLLRKIKRLIVRK